MILKTFFVPVLFDKTKDRIWCQTQHAGIVGTGHKYEYNSSLIGFHKAWFSWHLNEPCIWGNNPLSVWLLLEQEAETPAGLCVSMCVCVSMYGEHWGDCCFHASRPDALFAHCSFSFASTMLLFACLCVPAYNTALRGASCLSITGNGAHWSGWTETERSVGATV